MGTINVVGREEEVAQDEIGDTILRDEYDRALKDLGRNKTTGVDDISSELLKSLGEPAMTKLFELVCKMCETDEITSDFKKNVIITIPKCSNVCKSMDQTAWSSARSLQTT